MKYATFEMFAAVYNDREAWYYFDKWRQFPLAEIEHFAKPITKAEWDKRFDDLPDLPERR
jgi:hypothetical protein